MYKLTAASLLTLALSTGLGNAQDGNAAGVTAETIRLGSVLALEGDAGALGSNMAIGMQAAFAEQKVHGRTITLETRNDFYSPDVTATETQKLIDSGVFAMIGNVGTPTAARSLPLLAQASVPAIGFFTGAGLLRPGQGNIFNFRASYKQETAAVIEQALKQGVQPQEICAYVQNDGYGMAGIAGVRAALNGVQGAEKVITRLDMILQLPHGNPGRNGIGPVGVYQRNTLRSQTGYKSLKQWEASSGSRCRVVVTVGAYAAISNFIGYAKALKEEPWLYTAVSFTGAHSLADALSEYDVTDGVIVTEVVPPLASEAPLIVEARKKLGEKLNNVSLEGYIVGKLFLNAAERAGPDLTRNTLIQALQGQTLDLGGLTLDYSTDNQGSDQVYFTTMNNGEFSHTDGLYLTTAAAN